MLRFFLVIFVWVLFSGFSDAQQVKEIRIFTSQTGLFRHTESNWVVKSNDKGFVVCSPVEVDDCSLKVENLKIEALLNALNQPPVEHLDVSLLNLFDPLELKINSKNALKGLTHFKCLSSSRCTEEMYNEVFLEIYENKKAMENLIERYYEGGWTDDYPFLGGEIVFTQRDKIKFFSYAQHAFMIPWKIEKNNLSYYTYHPDISFALYDLLPDSTKNQFRENPSKVFAYRYFLKTKPLVSIRQRLEGNLNKILGNIFHGISGAVSREIEIRYSREKLGKNFEDLEENFQVRSSEIYNNIWRANIVVPSLGPDIVISFEKNLNRIKESEIFEFTQKLLGWKKRILGVPWLKPEFHGKEDWIKDILIIEGFSWINSFSQRVKKMMPPGIGKTLAPFMKDAIPLTFWNGSPGGQRHRRAITTHWLLFSDYSMLLNKIEGNSPDKNFKDVFAVGAPFGKIISEKELIDEEWVAWINPDGTLRKLFIEDDIN